MSRSHPGVADAESLVADLKARLGAVERRLAEEPLPAETGFDLIADRRHLERLVEDVRSLLDRRGPGAWTEDLPPRRPPSSVRPPLAVRAVRVLLRQIRDQAGDLLHAAAAIRGRRLAPEPSDGPLVSVIVPTRDRRELLLHTLDAYERQSTDLPFEIVVVDDGSTDGSADAAEALAPRRYDLRVLRRSGAGPAAARNHALEVARAPLVLFTGDDVEPEPDLVLRHWQGHHFHDDPEVAILGHVCWAPELELTATMRHVDGPGGQQFNFGWMRAGRAYDFRHFYTSNLSLRRERLERVGGFSTDFPDAAFEDAELAHRLSFHGLRVVYHPDAVGRHHHPYDAAGFAERQHRCGRMARVLLDLHPELALWTAVPELEQRRVDLLCLGDDRRRRLEELAAELDAWQGRCLEVAATLDREAPPGTDAFLGPFFHLAFVQGLSEGREGASRSCASLLADSLRRPSRALLPRLSGAARDAAAELADLPGFCGPFEIDFLHPVRKNRH